MLELFFFPVVADTHLKADKSLCGSSHIDFVRDFVSTDGALSFCMCVCYDAYCYVFLNFLAHIEPQTDFTSLEIEGNIQAWYRIGHAVYIRWVSYILFYYGIVLFPLGF